MEIDRENLHHAYLVLGNWSEDIVGIILDKLGVEKANNPDLRIFPGFLDVDTAREITEIISTRPFSGMRVVVINGGEFNVYAQNALLKTIEEAPEGNHIFYIAPNDDLVLPTLRSRMQKVSANQNDFSRLTRQNPTGSDATRNASDSPLTFLKLSPAKRLDFAKKFKDSEKPLGPFLDSLLSHLKLGKDIKSVEKVFEMRRFADDGGSDARLILEHLALTLE